MKMLKIIARILIIGFVVAIEGIFVKEGMQAEYIDWAFIAPIMAMSGLAVGSIGWMVTSIE
jgi:hypothetical protein